MEREHSLLNPSSANIWLTCTRAPRFAEKFEKKTSNYADEGTLCHSIATDQLNCRLGRLSKKDYQKQLAFHRDHELYKDEMERYAEGFVSYVLDLYYVYKQKGCVDIWIEKRIDYSHIAPEGYGHLDVCILSPSIIDVIDFKYGKGIPVSAIANVQLGLYALGVIEATLFYDEFEKVNLHIYQPRIDNISTYTNTVQEYIRWGNTTVKKAAQLAYNGEGDFRAGTHCRWCPAKINCKASTDYHTSLAKYDFKVPYEMDIEEIAEALLIGESLVNWYNAIKEYASEEARKGVKVPGFKLVAGKSMRKYADSKQEEIVKALLKAGYKKEQIEKSSLIGITEMTKLLGEGKLNKLLGKYIIKPPGIPTLVPESDRRKSINGKEGAKQDFKNIKI